MTKTRNYGIDLLRLLSMFMVVVLHIFGRGGFCYGMQAGGASLGYKISEYIIILTYCAVDLFALISGYVGISSKHKCKSIVLLWFEVLFYSVIITGIIFLWKPECVGGNDIIGAFFPVLSKRYWYFTAYFLLFILKPVVNNGLKQLNQKQHGVLIIVLFLATSLFPVFTGIMWTGDPFETTWGSSAIWLILLYIVGAYFGLYGITIRVPKVCLLIFWMLLSLIVWLGVVFDLKLLSQSLSYISPFIVLNAVLLFLFFLNNNNKHFGEFITKLSAGSFGVYLIHTHPIIYRDVLKDAFVSFATAPLWLAFIKIIGSCFVVFIACLLIDLIRIRLFSVLRLNRIAEKIGERVDHLFGSHSIA